MVSLRNLPSFGLARAAYTALAYALLPYARARLAWRGRSEPGYREHVAERFGRYDARTDERGVVWIHAVSVGETRAAEPLVRALAAHDPAQRILVTHMTPTGRRTSEALFGDRVLRCYIPYDYPAAVERFLDHFQPRLGIIMETEIWPNLVHTCSVRGVPLVLANARLSERSYRGYRRVSPLVREALSAFSGVAAQSEADAERLVALGAPDANVIVAGNLKFDVVAATELVERGQRWRETFADRHVVVAASTRDGEEALLLGAFLRLGTPRSLLVIVPRHPQRFAEVAALLERRGVAFVRRGSGAGVGEDTRVLLGDSMGEMAAYYAAADAAIIGGSLLPFGGQNLIEACAVGKPVVIGPHTYNFAEAAEQAVEAGAATRVHTAEDAIRAAFGIVEQPDVLRTMEAQAIAFSRAHQGATARVMRMIEEVTAKAVKE
jgi:3-deoxy-D-manno-octulosonic-acid transferase